MIIDISKFQNKISWPLVKVDGIYIKATEGVGYVDEMFKSHVIGANSINVKIGFYHFATLNSKDVLADSAAEATAFYNAIKGIGVGLPYVLDIEKNPIGLSKQEVVTWIHNFFLTLHLRGINDVCLYSYTSFLNENLTPDHGMGDIKLWIAQYSKQSAPTLPMGWKTAWLWQFASNGVVPGIVGNVDESKLL